MKKRLTHFDDRGQARMVEVGGKVETAREAVASGEVRMARATAKRIANRKIEKGDVLAVARLAGIQATKRAHDLIPLCHPLRVTGADLELTMAADRVKITATVRAYDRTGIEMEALTAVAVAALTVYDMCKAIDRGMILGEIRLEEKRGGKTGHWRREASAKIRSRSRRRSAR